tara:strand:- start:171881 stop:172330 length:450 start_codon:yes stop_codon:yes gene_type:complete
MKKVISILVLFIGLNALAQKREMQDLTPEQFATLSTKKMTLALDLNESQQTKIYQMTLENATKRKAKREEHKKSMASNQSKKPTADERYTMQSAMLDHQIAQKKKMKSILSSEQFEKWEQMKHKRMDMHIRKGAKKDGPRKHKMEKEKQ